jgi:hypothetical protein
MHQQPVNLMASLTLGPRDTNDGTQLAFAHLEKVNRCASAFEDEFWPVGFRYLHALQFALERVWMLA